jgi:hypothetical protein
MASPMAARRSSVPAAASGSVGAIDRIAMPLNRASTSRARSSASPELEPVTA